jgi:hypothetical protein
LLVSYPGITVNVVKQNILLTVHPKSSKFKKVKASQVAHAHNHTTQELRQEDPEFKARPSYIVTPCLTKPRAGVQLSGRGLAYHTRPWVQSRGDEGGKSVKACRIFLLRTRVQSMVLLAPAPWL